MEIKITVKDEEACNIIKEHVLGSLPDSTIADKKIEVSQSYGDFTIYIEDKVKPIKDEEEV